MQEPSLPTWIRNIENAVRDQALQGFSSRSATQASSVNAAFSSYLISTSIAAQYVRNVLRLPGSTADTVIPTQKAYTSYFAARLDNNQVDPPQPPAFVVPFFSAYYKSSITTSQEWSQRANSDNTSTFDNAFRAITLTNPNTQAIQAGFEDDGWRVYPLVYNIARYDPRAQTPCSSPDAPPALRAYEGYNPRCRPWYTAATDAANVNKAASIATGLGPAVMSPPYVSSVSGGRALITASQAFFNEAGQIGVIGLQVQIDTLNDNLTGVSILKNGYIFVVDVNGYIVLYPRKKASVDPFKVLTKLSTLEFANDEAAANLFISKARKDSAEKNGAVSTFSRRGLSFAAGSVPPASLSEDEWTFSASYIPSTNNTYLLVVMVPSSDISALSDSMRNSTTLYARAALGIAMVLIIVAGGVSMLITRSVARRVLKPVEELTGWLTRISSTHLDEEVADAEASTHELKIVKQNFKNLLIAVRFGNDAYYANDLSKALANYEAAERLMVELRNERGRGVCLNNKGNVYKQMDEGELARAVNAYSSAIEIAETLLAVETNPAVRTTIQVTLANRISNLGVVYKDADVPPAVLPTTPVPFTPNQERARNLFLRSLELHRGVDGLEGIAQVSGNLGQLYLETGRIPEATEMIRDGYDIVKDRNDHIALQYACMNMGLLAVHIGRPAEAVTWFTFVLQRFGTVVSMVQRTCASEIVRICEEKDPKLGVYNPELARAIRELATPLFGDIWGGNTAGGSNMAIRTKPRDLYFVLDCSGSMSGGFIRACRASIEDIIRRDCRMGDRISLTTFQSTFRQVFPLTEKKGPYETDHLIRVIQENTNCDGATAFYDAVYKVFYSAEASAGRDTWVVALTDGGDNSSSTSVPALEKEIVKHRGVGLIVITVGNLENEPSIRRLVAAACNNRPHGGVLVKAEQSSDGIREAFGKVSKMIVGNLRHSPHRRTQPSSIPQYPSSSSHIKLTRLIKSPANALLMFPLLNDDIQRQLHQGNHGHSHSHSHSSGGGHTHVHASGSHSHSHSHDDDDDDVCLDEDGPNEEDRVSEEKAYNKVLRSFKGYRQHALQMNEKRRRDFEKIPERHRNMVPEYHRRLAMVDQRILTNAGFLESLLEGQGNPDVPVYGVDGKPLNPEPVMESDMDKVRSTLKQFVRDWSAEGKEERDATYKPILDTLERYFKDVSEDERGDIAVLVPGAGLARLAYDIVKRGFTCQGNEFSFFMLLGSNFVLNRMTQPQTYEIFPWVHSFSNFISPEHQLRSVTIPDTYPGDIPPNANFSMVAGDFLEVYSHKNQKEKWDVIVTCYFIDTAKNIIAYLEVLAHTLKSGGLWINLGPLLYHFEGMKNEISIDLNQQEIQLVAKKLGFEFLEESRHASTYTGNPTGMLQYSLMSDSDTEIEDTVDDEELETDETEESENDIDEDNVPVADATIVTHTSASAGDLKRDAFLVRVGKVDKATIFDVPSTQPKQLRSGINLKDYQLQVVVPLSVLNNWTSEFEKFVAEGCLQVVSFYGSKEERGALKERIEEEKKSIDVIVTTYETVYAETSFLQSLNFKFLVVDEAHRLKNTKSNLFRLLMSLEIPRSILLTGTPIQNNISELAALMAFSCPSLFAYKNGEAAISKWFGRSPSLEELIVLRDAVEPFIMRREKSQVIKLPDMQEFVLFAHGVEPEPFEAGEHLVEASGKLALLDRLLTILKKRGHKVLIFSQMTHMLDILQDFLSYRKILYERLDGSVRGEERFIAIKRFSTASKKEPFVFLLSTRAGGVGLNLVAADTVIFFDTDFNPAMDMQAAARVHRIGQTKKVRIFRLLSEGSVDEIIWNRANEKKALGQFFMDHEKGGNSNASSITTDDLATILKFGLGDILDQTESDGIHIPSESELEELLDRSKSQDLRVTMGGTKQQAEEEPDISSSIYTFDGIDYKKDEDAFKELVADSLQVEAAESLDSTAYKTRRYDEETAKQREHEAAVAATRAKERKLALKEKQKAKWLSKGYISSAIDSDDEDEATMADMDRDDGDDVDFTLQYVTGDVSKPNLEFDEKGIIVHVVDNSGSWPHRGIFASLSAVEPNIEQVYAKAAEYDDLKFGSAHLIKVERTEGENKMQPALFIALIIAQKPHDCGDPGALRFPDLEKGLEKVANVDTYGTNSSKTIVAKENKKKPERAITSTTRQKKRKRQSLITSASDALDLGIEDPLPDYFHGQVLDAEADDDGKVREAKRKLIAFGGIVSEEVNEFVE
ncbi:Chromodomain-helicase-DNA-binding protein 1-like [Phlyctochytrium planicorne]|nr:Chromodomain-helicase-DNA-binding protein 1-like [Phlyctochytrium planicorne]